MKNSSNVFVVDAGLKATEIGNKVYKALSALVQKYAKKVVEDAGCRNFIEYNNNKDIKDPWEKLSCVVDIHSPDFQHFIFKFSYDGKTRCLHMYTHCGFDYKEVNESDDKIIFSLGHWGSDEEIINLIAETIKDYGHTYKIINDCSGEWEYVA